MTLIAGDSYTDTLDRGIVFQDGGNWPSLVGATLSFKIGTGNSAPLITHTPVVFEAASQTAVLIELTSTETALLRVSTDKYHYSLTVILADLSVMTLAYGLVSIPRSGIFAQVS